MVAAQFQILHIDRFGAVTGHFAWAGRREAIGHHVARWCYAPAFAVRPVSAPWNDEESYEWVMAPMRRGSMKGDNRNALFGLAPVMGPIAPVAMCEARGWVADCGGHPESMTDGRVIVVVEHFYEGGWAGFINDISCLLEES